jgi:hypothetical protein
MHVWREFCQSQALLKLLAKARQVDVEQLPLPFARLAGPRAAGTLRAPRRPVSEGGESDWARVERGAKRLAPASPAPIAAAPVRKSRREVVKGRGEQVPKCLRVIPALHNIPDFAWIAILPSGESALGRLGLCRRDGSRKKAMSFRIVSPADGMSLPVHPRDLGIFPRQLDYNS